MNKRPILVAFSNQKGGVGKSTVTIVLASYFNYVKGLNVAVVDCDYPQFSLDKLRGRDLKNLEKSEYHQRLFCRQFENSTRKAYPIVTSTPEEAAKIPGRLEGDYDLIFFDLPGTVNSRGVFDRERPDGHAEQSFLCFDRAGLHRSASECSLERHTSVLEPHGQPHVQGALCDVQYHHIPHGIEGV